MRSLDVRYSVSLRLAALYVGLFALSWAILVTVVYYEIHEIQSAQVDASIDLESDVVADEYRSRTPKEFRDFIDRRVGRPGNFFGYLVVSPQKTYIAGDLPPLIGLTDGWHWFDLTYRRAALNGPVALHRFRGFGRTMADGGFILIGYDLESFRPVEDAVLRSFGWSALGVLVLAVVGSMIMISGILRRVEEINQASEAIVVGDLAARLPTRAPRAKGDEFDRLAWNLNDMLGRIQMLVEGLRQVSSDIAHDLRTPLGRLRRRVELIREREAAQGHAHLAADLDSVVEQADELLATFGALLRIAQIEAGTAQHGFVSVDLSGIVEAVVEVFGPSALDKKQTLTATITPSVMTRGDKALLTQLVANIVENAVTHSPPGSAISVTLTGASGQGGRLNVSDSGPGIPADEHSNVFRRFYRLDRSRSTPGNGLGLALVAAIAELHGAVTTLAEAEPSGLRFTVDFRALAD